MVVLYQKVVAVQVVLDGDILEALEEEVCTSVIVKPTRSCWISSSSHPRGVDPTNILYMS